MKTRSRMTSIFEISTSTIIFVVVAFSAILTLIAMNQKNKNVEYLVTANNCKSQISSKILTNYSNANSNDSSIYGIEKQSDDFIIKQISKFPGKSGEFIGFLSIDSKNKINENVSLVLKLTEDGQSSYWTADSIISDSNLIKDNQKISELFTKDQLKQLSDCKYSSFLSNITKPFKISIAEGQKNKSGSKNSFDLQVSDSIYSSKSNKIFSVLFIRESKIYD